MSQKTTVAFHCDICDAFLCNGRDFAGVVPSRIEPKFETMQITIIENQEWATDVLEAKQICSGCQDLVKDFMRDLRNRK